MEQDQFTRQQAFDVLRVASQDTNRKLSDIAIEVATPVPCRSGAGRRGRVTAAPPLAQRLTDAPRTSSRAPGALLPVRRAIRLPPNSVRALGGSGGQVSDSRR